MPSSEQILAIATVSVGVGPGGGTCMVARVAVIGYRGHVLWDKCIAPTMPVSDYRTASTGITAAHLLPANGAVTFQQAQHQVAFLIKGKILVGHTLWNDLSVLGIPHPAVYTRDVALYQPFRNALQQQNQLIGLRTLVWQFMRRQVGDGVRDATENARASLDLYRSVSGDWEASVAQGRWPCALPPSSFSRCYE